MSNVVAENFIGMKTEFDFRKHYGGYIITINYEGREVSFLGCEAKSRGSWKKSCAVNNALYGMNNLVKYKNLFTENATDEKIAEKFKDIMDNEMKLIDARKKSNKDT